MNRLSPGADRLWRRLTGERGAQRDTSRLTTGPTMVRVQGGEDIVEHATALYDRTTGSGRAPNSYLARRRSRLGVDESGAIALEGRACCMALARKIDRELARLRLPERRVCTECGTTWSIEMRPREERRHGW